MNTKHTPGPWHVGRSHTSELAIRAQDAENGECVAVACEISDDEMHANAHLIAAAPRMAEILDRIANSCEEFHYRPGVHLA